MLDVAVLGLPEEEGADDEGHEGDDDGVPEAVVDVAGGGDHGGGGQRQHAAEPAVADVIGERHRRVADLRREQLDEIGGDGAVDHGHVEDHDEQHQDGHREIDLGLVGRSGIVGGFQGLLELGLVPALDLDVADLGDDGRVGGAGGRPERQALLGEEVLGLVALGELAPRADEDMEIAVGGGDRDAGLLLIRLQRRIDVMGQRLEQREVGDGGDQAAEHDDLQAADLVGQPAEEDEERRGEQQRGADEDIAGQVVELQRDGEEEQRVELAGVPDDALAGGGAEQGEQHVLVVRILEEAVAERRLGALALGLHPLEDRRLAQLQADIDGEEEQDDGDQERNAPAPFGERRGVHDGADAADDGEGEEEAQGGGGLDEAGVVAALAVGGVLGDVGGGAAVLAAEGQALQQTQADEQDRREPTDALVGRQKADGGGGEAHDQDGDQEGVLAADHVAEAAEDQRAERPHQEAGGVGGEGGQQGGGVVALGKEQRGEERRQGGVQIKVVPLEHGAQRGGEDDSFLLLDFFCRGRNSMGRRSH